ncbi:MFS transporter [Rhodococcus sp. 06-462-5]|uniref:MFS transporter n=1 Tax=unclassified Rhodococcus (in: high G+C Gram-positive bacteria) TaxID=192944 RepID=UPI000B9C6746|nr:MULTISPECIES: MFS transporter [unclassified Rhodococcus (in: high G+C Gram-positive bacteria)]OZC79449.1 MFS transporter [Rhodococcus sp. 06-462-5]OZE60006.1 MFS transporter [Rhodococcus sp. 02-925g]
MSQTATEQRATGKEWLGLAVLVVPILVVSMDMSVLYLALPFMTADLEPTGNQSLWILDIYGFLLAGLLITMGSLGDRIGRRTLLMIGAVVFGAASLAATFSTSPEMLLAARALLGIGGATIAPSTLSLIRNMFHDPAQRKEAIGLWTAGFAGGAAVGPVIGGVLLEHFWWGSVFLINIPIMVVLFVAAPLLVPEFKDSDPGKFDPISVVLAISSMLSIVFAIKHGAQEGIDAATTVTALTGLALGAVFVIRQRKAAHPLIDVTLFAERAFSAAVVVQFLVIFAMTGFSLFAAQYLQLVVGLGPLEAGLWLLIPAAAAASGAVLAPTMSKVIPTGTIIACGLAFIGFGCVAMVFVTSDSGLPLLLSGMALLTFGIGAASTLNSDIVLTAAAPEKAGAASALSETGAELGGAVGIAILGTIGSTVYRHLMDDAIPAGTPAEIADPARETIGGAIAVADYLPEPFASQLTTVANSSFVDGFNLAAGWSAGLMAVSGVTVFVLLRRQTASER